ncbi:RlpA-like double-psi beta-barrel-protein domain-containing protein-containing protein [Rhexocercosporidium sp. MPI-PUGE-AT-0058]|nr:RlpA-like double-psi beta-barrel-protein domain-containing protein-containing protein [Rhexocercosporidium sp. MPI-PUGE-AT-0058]
MTEAGHQLPDWEAPAPKKSIFSKHTTQSPPTYAKEEAAGEDATTVNKRSFSDRYLPRFVTRSRKSLLITISVLILLLVLILGLGLGLGLSHKKNKTQNLPLPTSKGVFNGDLTYYSPGPGFGACGYENKPTDAICAVAHALWDSVLTSSNPNENPLCGKMIRITRYNEAAGANRSVDVMVVDKCMGCEPTDLDLSIKMFTTLAEESLGRVVGSWAWLD